MPLPAIAAAIAGGVASAGTGFGLSKLFGGGGGGASTDPAQFLESYRKTLDPIWSGTMSYYDQKLSDQTDQINSLMSRYASPQSAANFRSQVRSNAEKAKSWADRGIMTYEDAKDWFSNEALKSGIRPGDTLTSDGNTLLDIQRAFDVAELENAPKNWEEGLQRTYRQLTGRDPTKGEYNRYSQANGYQNMDQVLAELKNTYEVARRNPTSDMDAMAQWYYGGRQVMPGGTNIPA